MNVLKPHFNTTIDTLLSGVASHREIERRTGADRKTIRRYARAANSPTRDFDPATDGGVWVATGVTAPPCRALRLHAPSMSAVSRLWFSDVVRPPIGLEPPAHGPSAAPLRLPQLREYQAWGSIYPAGGMFSSSTLDVLIVWCPPDEPNEIAGRLIRYNGNDVTSSFDYQSYHENGPYYHGMPEGCEWEAGYSSAGTVSLAVGYDSIMARITTYDITYAQDEQDLSSAECIRVSCFYF